jgi:small subunit ribosomal protein S27e
VPNWGVLVSARPAATACAASDPALPAACVQVLAADLDLLNPPAELEKRKHKLKRLVQSPNSFFMDVKCQARTCFVNDDAERRDESAAAHAVVAPCSRSVRPSHHQGCFTITTVFSHSQTVVLCGSCSAVLCQPTGGRARLTEGAWHGERGTPDSRALDLPARETLGRPLTTKRALSTHRLQLPAKGRLESCVTQRRVNCHGTHTLLGSRKDQPPGTRSRSRPCC